MLIPNCWYKDEYMSSSDPCSGEVIKNGYDELLQFIKEFNRRKEAQQAQEEMAKQQEALANRKMTTNDNKVLCNRKGVLIDSNQILDPLKYKPKGRPLMKRLKSFVEKSSSKGRNENEQTISDRGHKCGSCGENGHYQQLRMLIDERKNNNECYHDLVEEGKKMFWKELASKINLRFGTKYTGGNEKGKKTRNGEKYYEEFSSKFWKKPVTKYDKLHFKNMAMQAEKEKAAKTLLLLSEEGNHHYYNDDNDNNDDNE
ncbi:hypothetical protein RhiirA5_428786 [Rhizophagus irregularis]|uniref:Uncharacterized protein n=1 Tax=Rhizophagus irregularis TaxID=588596 RepID=A0A2N0NZP7_9GLOM|nr:hypothetical protein RhiirA5_428786 [Rhizophagus irregularis]